MGEIASVLSVYMMIDSQAMKHVGKTSESFECRSGQEELYGWLSKVDLGMICIDKTMLP